MTESESDSESNGVGTGSSETQSGETGSSETNGGDAGSSETNGGDDDEDKTENTVSFTYTDAKTWYEENVATGNVWCDDSEYQAAENGIFITGIENAGENVVIPTTIDGYPVTGIAPSAFADCTQIKSVAVEDSEESQLTYILKKAFEGCTSLETVSLAKALRCVDGAAFSGCTALGEFIADWAPLSDEELSERGEMYVAVDAEGVLFTLGGKRLTKYPAARSAASYDIPEGTVVLGGSSFSGAANLTNVTIPDTLRELNVVCFQSSGLTSIVLPSTVVRIDGGAFDDCTSLESIEVQSADTSTADFGTVNEDTIIICHRDSSAANIAESKELTTIFYDYPYSISELAGYRGYSVDAPEKSAYISPDMIDIPALTDGVSGTVYTGEPVVIDTYDNIHLTGIRILPDPNDPSAVGGTVVEGSNDNESWSEVYSFENGDSFGTYYADLDGDAQENYRYFRVSRDGGLDISELELWYEYYRETVDGLTYTFELRNDGSGVNIKDVYAEEGFDSNSIVIPETLGGQPVRRINYGTFAGLGDVADTITSITLPSTLTECGASFEWLNNITEVKV
ncbi:MAG: leucine-rich repeat domain-containing protein, partial [Candidatus Flemingiibacterium sp.]